jgi:WD40 repeat protein
MAGISRLLVVVLGLLIGGVALAQEPKGWFGAAVQDVTKEEADKLRWDAPHGAKVREVQAGSPAAKAGLKVGDIILTIDRTEIDAATDFDTAIDAKRPGAEVRLSVLSGGRQLRVAATLVERPKSLAADERTVPQLILDTGGHMGVIKGIAFTPDGKHIVSSGDDKVIRIWDWQAGRTVRTIHGQVGPADEGKVLAMALSPDGRWLAAGGWMKVPGESGHVIRVYDFATGRLTGLLKGHTNVVNGIAASADGKHLISGQGGGATSMAIIWDVASRKPLHYLKGHKAPIYGVVFSADSARAVTASDDTTLRLWRVSDGSLITEMKGHTSDLDRALAVRASDGMIASGDSTGEIRLWDGSTGQYLRTFGTQGTNVGVLVYSPDGKRLLSTCGGGGCSTKPQIIWDMASGKRLQQPKHHDNVVIAAAISPDGRLVATGGGNNRKVHVWDIATGETRRMLVGDGASRWATGFSPDGSRIAWGSTSAYTTHNARGPFELQLRLPGGSRSLGRPEPIDEAAIKTLVRASQTFGAYALSHRKGGAHGFDAILDLKLDGRTLASIERGTSTGYDHRAYTFSPDGQTIISAGSNGILTAYDLKGKVIGDFIGHEGDVWAVAPSADGRLLVTGSGDQTVRLWNLKTRELIATLFRGTDSDWVMWTPQGYYTGSPGSDKYVGWQINKGPANAADYVGADQLRRHLHRPDIVEKAIILASAEQAVAESPGTTFKLADLLAKPVPRFRIVSPASGATQRGRRAEVKIDVEAVPDPIKFIRVQVNGRQVDEITPEIGTGGLDPGQRTLDVPLGEGRNEIRITLGNAIGVKAETLTLVHQGNGDLDQRGTLYILAVGVDRYPGLGNTCGEFGNASCDLRYSGADARRLADAAERRLKPAHAKVVKRVLVNGAAAADAPTAGNILDAIDILKQARETDTVLLFIAGHGANDGSNYRFLATNAERAGSTFRSATVVPWQFLQDAIETTKGRRILFIDTCHSGNAYNQQLGNAAYHANIIAYTSARFDQEALEDSSLGHGLFTYAVVEGLDGKGAMATKREISTKELAEFVVKRVDQLAKTIKGQQEPQYFKGRDADDYVLAKW